MTLKTYLTLTTGEIEFSRIEGELALSPLQHGLHLGQQATDDYSLTSLGLVCKSRSDDQEERRAETGRERALRGERLLAGEAPPVGVGGVARLGAFDGVGRRGDAGLFEGAARAELAGRFDGLRQDKVAEHLVPAGGVTETDRVVGAAQRVDQVRHPRGDDRHRGCSARRDHPARNRVLTARPRAAACDRLERGQFRLVVCGLDVVSRPRTASIKVHDLHRSRARRGLHGAQIGHESAG